ncbi:MAG: ABC transporter ATP-binding protein [Candidatus Nanopelagicales bacterium]
MSARIEARGITVPGRLNDVSVAVAGGEVHALVGPNGSGKSTLLAVLAGDLRPSGGTVAIEGTSWSSVSARDAARRRALLTQETPLAFPFTVREVVTWGRLPWRGSELAAQDDRIVSEVLAEHGLGDLLDRPVTSLSGGERARVHLARVLAQRAPVLLLDEADAALDLAGQAHLDVAVRRRRAAGDAIVIVGHDLGRLAALADTVTLLSHGRVVGQGSVETTLSPGALTQAYGVPVASSSIDGRTVFWSEG